MTELTNVVRQQCTRMENPEALWFPQLLEAVTKKVGKQAWQDAAELRREVRVQIKAQQQKLLKKSQRVARKISNGDKALTQDLMQVSWVAALSGNLPFPTSCRTTRGHMKTHLKETMSPVTVPHWRISRAKHQVTTAKEFAAMEELSPAAQPGLTPEENLAIREVFLQLDPKHQQAIKAAYIDENGVSGVAYELKMSIGEAEKMLDRAMLAFRTLWNL